MTDTTPESTPETAVPAVPAPPAADAAPVSPYVPTAAAVPTTAAPVATAPVAYAPKLPNRLGLAALIVLIIGYIIPIVAFVLPLAASSGGDSTGWAFLGGFVFFLIALIPAGIVILVAIVLAIISLLRAGHSKVLGIITIILGAPALLVAIIIGLTAAAANMN